MPGCRMRCGKPTETASSVRLSPPSGHEMLRWHPGAWQMLVSPTAQRLQNRQQVFAFVGQMVLMPLHSLHRSRRSIAVARQPEIFR